MCDLWEGTKISDCFDSWANNATLFNYKQNKIYTWFYIQNISYVYLDPFTFSNMNTLMIESYKYVIDHKSEKSNKLVNENSVCISIISYLNVLTLSTIDTAFSAIAFETISSSFCNAFRFFCVRLSWGLHFCWVTNKSVWRSASIWMISCTFGLFNTISLIFAEKPG